MTLLRAFSPTYRLVGLCSILFCFGTLQACSGSGGVGSVTTTSSKGLSSAQGSELVAYVQSRLRQRQSQGWYERPQMASDTVGAPSLSSGAKDSLVSGTTVQEQGVDEDDLLKTDGDQLFSISYRYDSSGMIFQGVWLQSHRAIAGAAPQALTERKILDVQPQQIGLQLSASNNRLAVLSSLWQSNGLVTNLDLVSANSIDLLKTEQSLAIEGQLSASRLIGSTLYLVTVSTPVLPIDQLPYSASAAEREAAIAQTNTQQIIPKLRINGGAASPLFDSNACFLQASNAATYLQVTSITAIDLSSNALERTTRCFMGGTEAVYMAGDSLYLSTTSYVYATPEANNQSSLSIWRYPDQMRTDIHKFSVQGQSISYRGSGDIAGHLGWDSNKKPYRMSEHEGLLRVVSFTGRDGWWGSTVGSSATASPATLTVLREDAVAGALTTVSTLPNAQAPTALGKPGEQIYSVRFQGDKAYLVTFRQTDPLYVVDLSVPSHPRIAGSLTIPGYSDYLLPLSNGLLLGVGKDASDAGTLSGVKIALFDVSDPSNPMTLHSRQFGMRGSESGLSYSSHGISLLSQGNSVRVALPMRIHETSNTGPWYSPSYQALFGFEVLLAERTLLERGVFGRFDFASNASFYEGPAYGVQNLAQERSALIDSDVYYLSGGRLTRSTFSTTGN